MNRESERKLEEKVEKTTRKKRSHLFTLLSRHELPLSLSLSLSLNPTQLYSTPFSLPFQIDTRMGGGTQRKLQC